MSDKKVDFDIDDGGSFTVPKDGTYNVKGKQLILPKGFKIDKKSMPDPLDLMNTPPSQMPSPPCPWFDTYDLDDFEDEDIDELEGWLTGPTPSLDNKWKWESSPKKKSCTCGANSAYGEDYGAHSDWCDLSIDKSRS